MMENLDISDIPGEHETSNLSKQSSLRQLHEQTGNISGISNTVFPPQGQIIPIVSQSTGRRIFPHQNSATGQGQVVSPYIISSPTGSQHQISNAPLPPGFKRENANNSHSMKRSRQPIFSNPYQSNSLPRTQSPLSHNQMLHNTSTGSINGMKTTSPPIIPIVNQNNSLNQIKSDSFHTCVDQTNVFSTTNQHQNSLLFPKYNQILEKSDQKAIAPLQSPYLNLEKNDTESFMSVNSIQNVNSPIGSQQPNSNTNIHQISRRIFSNTHAARVSPPPRVVQVESPQYQSIDSKHVGQADVESQMQDLRCEMMKYADTFFNSLKRDIQDNNSKIQEVEQSFQDSQADIKNRYLGENRVLAKPMKIDNQVVERKVEQIVETKLKRLDVCQREIAQLVQNVKKDVQMKLDQSLSEALKGRAMNNMVDTKLEMLQSELEMNQRQKIESLTQRCKQLETNYQNSELFEDLNEFARNRASVYENKLLNLEKLLNKLKNTIDEKINIGDIKGSFKEIVEQKALHIQEQIDELKLQPQFQNSNNKLKSEFDQKLKQLERKLNDELYTLDTQQKLHINTKTDINKVNDTEEKLMRFNQDMKVLQSWYTKLNQDFSKIRVNNESNEYLLKQLEDMNERINVLHNQQNRLSTTQYKYDNSEIEGLYRELQNISKNLHEIDEYKKQKFELLEKKLNSTKEEMDKKIQNLILNINQNKQPISTLSDIPGIRIKLKQSSVSSAQKLKSIPSSDSNLTIVQTTNSTHKSFNTQFAQNINDPSQFSMDNFSNKNSVISSANNSYVYNQKQQPIVHAPSRSPLSNTQMQSNENAAFAKNQNILLSSKREGTTDEQILINSQSKQIRNSFTSGSKSQQQTQLTQNSEQRLTHYKFSEQFNDDDDDFEEYTLEKNKKILLNADSSEEDQEEEQEQTMKRVQTQSQSVKPAESQKPITSSQTQLSQKLVQSNRVSEVQNEKNRFQTYSITNEDANKGQVSENMYNPLENRFAQYNFSQYDSKGGFEYNQQHSRGNSITVGSNKQIPSANNNDNQIFKSGISDGDPINFDQLDGFGKNSISLNSSNSTPFNRLPSIQNQQYQQQKNQLTEQQQEEILQKYATFSNTIPLSIQQAISQRDPANPNQQNVNAVTIKAMQIEQRNKSDSSFATPRGSLNNSADLEEDKIYKQQINKQPSKAISHQQHLPSQNSQLPHHHLQQQVDKSLKVSQKTPDQSQNLEDLLDQFEDFNENNIDAMSNSGEFYEHEEEGDEEIYSYQNSTPNSKFSRTQGLSTLKNTQLNQINEEDNEEESNLGFSHAGNPNKQSINSNKNYNNNNRGSDQQSGNNNNNIKNSLHMQDYMDVIHSVKSQNNIYKIVDQIQRLLELKNEKKLRCYRDEVGYLKDANGFYIFDIQGRMIKTDKESIKYLQTEGYIQLL